MPASLEILQAAHRKAAQIVMVDPRAMPVFARLDRELMAERLRISAINGNDPVAMARALLAAQAAEVRA